MSEIKTIDDLIEYLDNSLKESKHAESAYASFESYEFGGESEAYEDALEKARELKANMEKQND